jgi:hypothetical protein
MASPPAFLLFLMLAVAGAVAAAAVARAVAAAAAARHNRPPPAVAVMNFTGYVGPVGDKISVGVETHDISIGGFTNGRGQWQSFPGHGHLFPGSTSLPFGDSYDELIGGLANLPDLPLGQEAMQQAARVLSAYDPATTTDFEPLKRALATLKVMLSEAGRLQPIREAIGRGWETESRVAPEHLPYIEHWDTMSYEIIRADRTGRWDGPFTGMLAKSANIRSMEEALAVVKIVLNARFEQVLMAHAPMISLE